MEFWLTLIGIVRRKRFILPALLVAIAVGATAFAATTPSYVSRTTMVLTLTEFGGSESRDPSVPTDLTNPMLNFVDSLTTTSAIMINAMNTEEVARELDATGRATLVVDDGRSNPELLGLNGPFLHIRVESDSPSLTAQVAAGAQFLIRDKLEQWQATLNAPRSTFIRLVDVVPTGTPEVERGGQVQIALLAAGASFGLCLVFAYLRHQVRARRRARALGRAQGPTSPARPDRRRGDVPRSDLAGDGDVESEDEPATRQARVLVPREP